MNSPFSALNQVYSRKPVDPLANLPVDPKDASDCVSLNQVLVSNIPKPTVSVVSMSDLSDASDARRTQTPGHSETTRGFSPSCGESTSRTTTTRTSLVDSAQFQHQLPTMLSSDLLSPLRIFQSDESVSERSNLQRKHQQQQQISLETAVAAATVGSKRLLCHQDAPSHPQQTPDKKKIRVCEDQFILHTGCQWQPTADFCRLALKLDPQAISRKCPRRRMPGKPGVRRRGEYTYPLNIALAHEASEDVLQVLASAGPQVLLEQDGPYLRTPLQLALQEQRLSTEFVRSLIAANPLAAMLVDSKFNTPLHTACAHGACLDIISVLCTLHPQALTKRNMNGETPLDICQRNSVCSEEVLNYLQQAHSDALESKFLEGL